jgi:hypothetical protein
MSFLAGTNISGQSSRPRLSKRYLSFAPHCSLEVKARARPESASWTGVVGSWSVEEVDIAVAGEAITVAVTLCSVGPAPPAGLKVARYWTNRAPPA